MLIFCIGYMVHVVLKQRRVQRACWLTSYVLTTAFRLKSHEKATVKIMGIVVGMFLVCNGIFISCSMVSFFDYFGSASCDDVEYKLPTLVLNSAVNPFVYALLKRDINNEFKKVTYVVTFKRGN